MFEVSAKYIHKEHQTIFLKQLLLSALDFLHLNLFFIHFQLCICFYFIRSTLKRCQMKNIRITSKHLRSKGWINQRNCLQNVWSIGKKFFRASTTSTEVRTVKMIYDYIWFKDSLYGEFLYSRDGEVKNKKMVLDYLHSTGEHFFIISVYWKSHSSPLFLLLHIILLPRTIKTIIDILQDRSLHTQWQNLFGLHGTSNR